MTVIIFAYTLVLSGLTLPTLSMEVASPTACVRAMETLLTSSIADSIRANGGSVVATCRVETR